MSKFTEFLEKSPLYGQVEISIDDVDVLEDFLSFSATPQNKIQCY